MNIAAMIIQQAMLFTIPLLLVALGGMFSERSGIINIALEGIMIMGAFAGILFIYITNGKMSGQTQLILAILISMAAGIFFSLFHAFASIVMKADQTIGGTALNMFAPAFTIYVARRLTGTQQIGFVNTFRIEKVPVLGDIPIIGEFFFKNAYITTYIGFLVLIISVIVLYYTRFGLRLRACGEHPQAADSVGINVYAMRSYGVIISGALGGLGGLVFVVPTSTNFNASVAGYGFLALAVLIFGQWHPVKILGASIFFGLMKTIAATYSVIPILNTSGIPSYIYKMVPYVATLIVLIFTSKNSQAPKAEGIPYDKGAR